MSDTSITVWGRKSSVNVQKVLWVLEELNLPYDRINAGGDFGGLDAPDYLGMNPHGLIPTVKDGETIIWESEAIARYLAARHGQDILWHDEPAARAQVDQWMAWTATRLFPDFITLFWSLVRTPPSKHHPAVIDHHRQETIRWLGFVERQLENKPFLLGDDLSLADIVAGAILYRWFEMDIERPAMANVEAWYDRLRNRAAYRNSVCTSFADLVAKESF